MANEKLPRSAPPPSIDVSVQESTGNGKICVGGKYKNADAIIIDVLNRTTDDYNINHGTKNLCKIYSQTCEIKGDVKSGEWSYEHNVNAPGDVYKFAVRASLYDKWAEVDVLAETNDTKIIWPTDVHTVTSGYGPRNGPNGNFHKGIDIGAPKDASIYAVLDGVVIENRWFTAGGWSLAIYNAEKDLTIVYMHMLDPSPVPVLGKVSQNQIIGNVGNTGGKDCKPPITYGYHLHFEIRKGRGAFVSTHENPLNHLP